MKPSIKFAASLAWARPASYVGAFFLLMFSFDGTTSSAGGAIAAIGGLGSVDDELGLWICL